MKRNVILTFDQKPTRVRFARVLTMATCPCLSVTSRCFNNERINLLFGIETFFDRSYSMS